MAHTMEPIVDTQKTATKTVAYDTNYEVGDIIRSTNKWQDNEYYVVIEKRAVPYKNESYYDVFELKSQTIFRSMKLPYMKKVA